MEKKKKFRIAKWIMLSLAILSNAFLISYSCLDNETTKKWNDSFSNIFISFVNSFTKKKEKVISLDKIDIGFSNEQNYKYNYIPGYDLEEIPLGSAKQIECTFSPVDPTNKAITYTASPSDSVVLNQSGSIVSVVGMKPGPCEITATSNDGSFTSKLNLNVVNTKAPKYFDISKENYEINIGNPETIVFDIDGGVLTHNELVNFRYYDTRELSYVSNNTSIAEVDEFGVIYPVSVGSTTVTVSNGEITKTLNISVESGTLPTAYSNLQISGSNVCYANDMILDQNGSHKNHYQLTPRDGETELNPEDFIWKSSNDLLAKVDNHGVLRGFRKSTLEDENVEITAVSKLTKQSVTFNVVVKNQIPSTINVCLEYGGQRIWDKTEYTVMVGEHIPVSCYYDVQVQNMNLIGTTSDESIISITSEGKNLVLHPHKEGDCTVKVISEINPELSLTTKYTVVKSGAIESKDVESLGKRLRKSVGHAAVFMVAQIFTFLALYMFLYDKKWWLYSSISLGEGLFICVLSELIQHFVPTRDGTVKDVFIDFAGVVVGFALAFLTLLLIKKIIKKKKEPQNK